MIDPSSVEGSSGRGQGDGQGMIAEGLQVLGNILSAATIAHPGRARAGERGRQASQTFDGRNRIWCVAPHRRNKRGELSFESIAH